MKDGKKIIISRLYQEIDVVKQKDSAYSRMHFFVIDKSLFLNSCTNNFDDDSKFLLFLYNFGYIEAVFVVKSMLLLMTRR